MNKRIIIGALVVVLVGALAVAALDLAGGSASADGGEQHGRSAQATGRGAGSEQSDGAESQGNGYGRQASEGAAVDPSEAAGGSQGRGRGAAGRQGSGPSDPEEAAKGDPRGSEPSPEPQANVEEWVEYGTFLVLGRAECVLGGDWRCGLGVRLL